MSNPAMIRPNLDTASDISKGIHFTKQIADELQGALKDVKHFGNDVAKDLQQRLWNINQVIQILNPFFDPMQVLMATITGDTIDQSMQLMASMVKLISTPVFQTTTNAVVSAINFALTLSSEMTKQITRILDGSIAEWTQDQVRELIAVTQDAVGDLVQYIQNYVRGIANAVSQTVVDTIRDGTSQDSLAVDIPRELANAALDYAQTTSTGIVQAVQSTGKTVVVSAQEFERNIVKGIQDWVRGLR